MCVLNLLVGVMVSHCFEGEQSRAGGGAVRLHGSKDTIKRCGGVHDVSMALFVLLTKLTGTFVYYFSKGIVLRFRLSRIRRMASQHGQPA